MLKQSLARKLFLDLNDLRSARSEIDRLAGPLGYLETPAPSSWMPYEDDIFNMIVNSQDDILNMIVNSLGVDVRQADANAMQDRDQALDALWSIEVCKDGCVVAPH